MRILRSQNNTISFNASTPGYLTIDTAPKPEDLLTPNGTSLDRSKLLAPTHIDNFSNSQSFAWVIPPDTPYPAYIQNTPWSGNFGACYYSQPGDGTHGVTFNDSTYGGLKLSLYQDSNYANNWYGGLISSCDIKANGFLAVDGYWEVNAKLPAPSVNSANSKGCWFAFWLCAHYDPALYGGSNWTMATFEYDVIEWYGTVLNPFHIGYHMWAITNPAYQTYWPWNFDITQDAPGLGYSSNTLVNSFNDYGILISDKWIRYYLNDVQFNVVHRDATFSTVPLAYLIDLVGGGGTNNDPVDGTGPFNAYVKQFKYSPLKKY